MNLSIGAESIRTRVEAQRQRKIVFMDLWIVIPTVALWLNLLFWITDVESRKSYADAWLGSKERKRRLMVQNFDLEVVISVLKTTF